METVELRIRLNFRRALTQPELQELVDRFHQLIETDVECVFVTDNNEVFDFELEHERITGA